MWQVCYENNKKKTTRRKSPQWCFFTRCSSFFFTNFSHWKCTIWRKWLLLVCTCVRACVCVSARQDSQIYWLERQAKEFLHNLNEFIFFSYCCLSHIYFIIMSSYTYDVLYIFYCCTTHTHQHTHTRRNLGQVRGVVTNILDFQIGTSMCVIRVAILFTIHVYYTYEEKN